MLISWGAIKLDRSKELTHRIMSSIKSKDTTPEKILGHELWKLGLRYRKQYKITGKPDFVFVRAKIAVFCDGDYWHGNNWRIRGMNSIEEELSRYTPYWANKIKRNIERDQRVNEELENEGWVVLRFWENSIKKNSQECAMEVYRVFQKRSKQCKCMSNKS